MGKTSIEWTATIQPDGTVKPGYSFNPWWGCTHVHEGRRHCYAESWAKRFDVKWGPNGVRRLSSDDVWKQPLKWNRAAEKSGVRAKVFCSSMADVFEDWSGPLVDRGGYEITVCHGCGAMRGFGDCGGGKPECERVPRKATMNDVRSRLFALIDATPYLDWQLLTKRPENIRRMWIPRERFQIVHAEDEWRSNVWLGTSISDQASADKQIPELLKCRDLSPVLFLSCEPLLGPIDLGFSSATCNCCTRRPSRWIELTRTIRGEIPGNSLIAHPGVYRAESNRHGALSVKTADGELLGVMPAEMTPLGPIDWVIAGGESGPHARPMHPEWTRSLRDQCQAADVPFFFKQHGEWLPWDNASLADRGMKPVHNFTDNRSIRVGKHAAGRLLDGVEWNQFPTSELSK